MNPERKSLLSRVQNMRVVLTWRLFVWAYLLPIVMLAVGLIISYDKLNRTYETLQAERQARIEASARTDRIGCQRQDVLLQKSITGTAATRDGQEILRSLIRSLLRPSQVNLTPQQIRARSILDKAANDLGGKIAELDQAVLELRDVRDGAADGKIQTPLDCDNLPTSNASVEPEG